MHNKIIFDKGQLRWLDCIFSQANQRSGKCWLEQHQPNPRLLIKVIRHGVRTLLLDDHFAAGATMHK
jgi:hypothetical protein